MFYKCIYNGGVGLHANRLTLDKIYEDITYKFYDEFNEDNIIHILDDLGNTTAYLLKGYDGMEWFRNIQEYRNNIISEILM